MFKQVLLVLFLAGLPAGLAAAPAGAVRISIVNSSSYPVHAAAPALDEMDLCRRLGTPTGTPLRVRTVEGAAVPFSRAIEDGQAILRVHVALNPQSRLDLLVERADRWPAHALVGAEAGIRDGTVAGRMHNGVVGVTFGPRGWSMGFAPAGGTAADRLVIRDGQLDFWADDQNRGRIMNADPKALGLARFADSPAQKCEASVDESGRPVVTVARRMGGLAKDLAVTETFELLPGLPVLVCRVTWRNTGDKPLWIAYVGSGDGIKGRWSPDLMPAPLIERKKSPLLGDLNGGETRPSWIGALCRISMESPASGCGVGLSTILPTPGKVGTGSMIWGCSASGFQCNFIDAAQGQFPFLIKPGESLENGFAFLATQAGVNVFRDTVELWKTIQAGKTPKLASPCALFIDGQPVHAQTIAELSGPLSLLEGDGPVRTAALRMDFNRYYQCRLAVKSAPVEISAKLINSIKPAVPLLRAAAAGEYTIDLNQKLNWPDEATFILELRTPDPAAVNALSIAEVLPVAPLPLSPLPDASFTDFATMFRWKAVPLVVDYELQCARTPDFASPRSIRIATSDPHPWYLPPDDALPEPGGWHWRVRGIKGTVQGKWSEARAFTINNDHSTKPVKRPLTPANPLFTLEASKVTDFTNFHPDIPPDIAPFVGIIAEGYVDKSITIDRFVRGLEKLPHPIMIRSHHPTWVNLPDLEWVCQNVPSFIGIQGGETLSMLYAEPRNKDNGDAAYHRRMLHVCAKYGMIYQEADGTYKDDKWQDLMDKQDPFIRKYGPWLVLTQKNNIIRRQFYSQSAAMGLWLGGITHQHGAWEDGGFYWQNAGFGELGECFGERRGVLKTMPRIFWDLVFVMGISRGCAIYSLDGQTLMFSPKEAERWPDQMPRALIWDTTGKTTDTFKRFVVPLIRGTVNHALIPTKEQVLANVKLAVYNDKKTTGDLNAWPHYVEYGPLYAGTYGFRTMGNIHGQLWEFFPNTGRYYYIPVLPQGDEPLAPHVKNLPVSLLQDAARVKAIFDAAYPARPDGDALACLIGDTLTIQSSHENTDAAEAFALPLRGRFASISGTLPPHAYILGKLKDGDRQLWLQANGEYPQREMTLSLHCETEPRWKAEPPAAVRQSAWDPAARTLTLRLSTEHGAVEVLAE